MTASPDPTPHERDTAALAAEMLAEVREEIDRADQKASLLIGSLGIAFSIVLSGLLGGSWNPALLGPVAVAVWALCAIAGSGAVLAAALAVWPRASPPSGKGAITYWGLVQGFSSPLELADALTERGLHAPERTYQQLLVLSALVQRKYRAIRWSMILAGIASLLVVVSFFIAL